jgi:GTP-binding protein
MAAEFIVTLATPRQVADACNGVFFHGHREPRFAFVGRSNVGKSSLLNALTRSRQARVSKEPGKTRCLHAYLWKEQKLILVDLPGYGFAKAAHSDRERWAQFINAYLKKDEGLCEAVVLLDARNGPTALDEEAIDFFVGEDVPVRIVMTKLDQLKTQSQRAARKKEVLAELKRWRIDAELVHWVSAERGDGISALGGMLSEVARATAPVIEERIQQDRSREEE